MKAPARTGRALAERLNTLHHLRPEPDTLRAEDVDQGSHAPVDTQPRGGADHGNGAPNVGAAAPPSASTRPRIIEGLEYARMGHVVLVGLPELVQRFEADLDPFLERIARIDARARAPRPELRLIEGDAMLAATVGLHVVKGGA